MIFVRAERGFTLVEVMVSLVIFMVVSMGLLPLLWANMRANQDNALHAKARRLAGQVITELQVIDYSRLATEGDRVFVFDDIEIRQSIAPDVPARNQSRVTVSAHWQQQGRSCRYPLQTIRSAP